MVGLRYRHVRRPRAADDRSPPPRQEPLDNWSPEVHVTRHQLQSANPIHGPTQSEVLGNRPVRQVAQMHPDHLDFPIADLDAHHQRETACPISPELREANHVRACNCVTAQHSQSELPLPRERRPPLLVTPHPRGSWGSVSFEADRRLSSPPPPARWLPARRRPGQDTGAERHPAPVVAEGSGHLDDVANTPHGPPGLLQDYHIALQ